MEWWSDGMRNKIAIWVVLAVMGIIVLLLLPPLHPPKARAQRITAVNNVHSVSLVITNTSTLPGAQPASGK